MTNEWQGSSVATFELGLLPQRHALVGCRFPEMRAFQASPPLPRFIYTSAGVRRFNAGR
jgi:hypothetical protein